MIVGAMPATQEYDAAVAFCESLLRPQTEAVDESILRQHFQRMGYFLSRLGNPQRRFPSVHIAGTSGKGSTTAMIGAIAQAASLRNGVHCTPYVQAPVERMQVDARYVTASDFVRLVRALQPHIAHMQNDSPYHDVSYREVAVAQAFRYFAEVGVDLAAIETGMGGRYDYTNHLTPLASVIVTVDYDHLATLGPTLDRIAYHKAGIIKDAVPVITGVTDPVALAVIEGDAAAHHAPLYRLQREFGYSVRSVEANGTVFDYWSPWGELKGLRVSMLGRHQAHNAALAASAALLLRQRWPQIDEEAIRRGLLQARLPGRLEIMQRHPTVVLDGAHNPEKMRSLTAALCDLFPTQKPVLVVGVLAAKQAEASLADVVPLASRVVVTTPIVKEKPAIAPDALAAICRNLGASVIVEPHLPAALEQAIGMAGAEGLVCVTGSLYMVGQARERWVAAARVVAGRTSFPDS